MREIAFRRVGAAILVVAAAAASVTASGIDAPASAASVAREAPDFASENYQDPWDYSNAEDVNTITVTSRNGVVSGGKLAMDIIASDTWDPILSIPGSLPVGRDGAAVAVDTSRYSRLSFQLNSLTARTDLVGALYWFTCREQLASCAGGVTFRVFPGAHVYDLDLARSSTIGAKAPWSGPITGLRFLPAINLPAGPRLHLEYDWMRLYQPTGQSSTDLYPPGTWNGTVVEPIPIPVIESPVPEEGPRLSAAEARAPWLFTTPAAAQGVAVEYARVLAYDDRGMTAQNAGPSGDPSVRLGVTWPFQGTEYHWFRYDLSYDGPFDLSGDPGGGKLARVIWSTSSTASPQESNDIVTFSGADQRPQTIDLAAGDPLDESSRAPRVGWLGQTITALRFDPNEDPGPNVWHLKSLEVFADPVATGSTTVKFRDAAWVSGTTADILVGTGFPGTPYTTIASNVAVREGTNSVPFDLGPLPGGAYRVEVVLHHPGGSGALRYSRTPIRMAPDPSTSPTGNLESLERAPGGAVATGWGFDAEAGGSIQLHYYVDGAFAFARATDQARTDVASAYPKAPVNAGFSTTVPLRPGQHTVCVYGINVGRGTNTLMGCRQIVTSPTPIGNLESAVAVPGGIRVSGWAIDPDTGSPIATHVYTGTQLTTTPSNRARGDLGRAFPRYGESHGFTTDVSVPPGTYRSCAYAIDDSGGENPLLGCLTTTTGTSAPIGNLDSVQRVADGVRVRGWALDPDSYGPVSVHLYVAASATPVVASQQRGDIAAAYPGWGAGHGFETTVAAPPGSMVCAYAIDDNGRAGNPLLGCSRV